MPGAPRQAGQLDRRVTILRAAKIRSGFNEQTDEWASIGAFYARREDVAGSESLRAGEVAAEDMVRFVVRYSPATSDITERDRVVFKGIEHNIVAVADLGRNQWRQIDAVARGDAISPLEA
jgi:SPP1 family predicted phage head-tail adaptor